MINQMQILIQSRQVQRVVQSYPSRAQETKKGGPYTTMVSYKGDSQRNYKMQI